MSGQLNPALVPTAAPAAAAVRPTLLQRAQQDHAFFRRHVSTIQSVVNIADAAEAFMTGASSKSSILPKGRLHLVNLLGTCIQEAQVSGYDDELCATYQAMGTLTQSWLFSNRLKRRIHTTLEDLRTGRLERQSRSPLLAALNQQNLGLQAEVKRLKGALQAKTDQEAKAAADVKAAQGCYDQEVKAKADLQKQNTDLQAALTTKGQELQQALDLQEKEVQAKSELQKQNAVLQLSLEAKSRELEEAKIRHAQELETQSKIIAQKDRQIDQLMAGLDKAITRLNQAEKRLNEFEGLMREQKEPQKEQGFDPRFFKGDRNAFSSNNPSSGNEKTADETPLKEQPDPLVGKRPPPIPAAPSLGQPGMQSF